MKKVLIAAGGTGGHILPALVVAAYLQRQNIAVHWLGTRQGLEHELVPAANIPIHYITTRAFRKKGVFNRLVAPFRLWVAIWQAMKIIKHQQITAVIGFGGFVSAPGGLAALLLKKPLIIHEQNTMPGLANRLLARYARQVFQAFPNTFTPNNRVLTSGNPVRAEIIQLPKPEIRFADRQGPLRLLILGGSQGAVSFNQIIPKTIQLLPVEQRPSILHVAGKRFAAETKLFYQQLDVQAQVVTFIDDMADRYAWADLVICRAGALTIAELAAAGVASIIIPYPYAVDDHQTKNAAWLTSAKAAVVISQQQFSVEKLQQLLLALNDRSRLLIMAIAARNLAVTHAAPMIGEAIIKEILK